jgi:3-isopropylmalate/(R)-2-methylmalate dehydratase small subunit
VEQADGRNPTVYIEGVIHKLGDQINTDVILPGRYLAIRDPAELGKHCLEGLDPEFAARVQPGDILVAGRNFGAIQAVGIGCIVAASFARIFYRNAINIGLPVVTCEGFALAARDLGKARIDLDKGEIIVGDQTFRAERVPNSVQQIIRCGGLVSYVRQRLETGNERSST